MNCIYCKCKVSNSSETYSLTDGRTIHFSCLNKINLLGDETENNYQAELLNLHGCIDTIQKKNSLIKKYSNILYKAFHFLKSTDRRNKIIKLQNEINELYLLKGSLDEKISQFSNEIKKIAFEKSTLLSDIYDFWPDYPPDWEDRKQNLLDEIDYCQECEEEKRNLHVHHIIPLGKGGSNTKNNLMVLCRECHEEIHKTQFGDDYYKKPSTHTIDKIKIINEAISTNRLLEIKYIDFYHVKTNRRIKPLRIFKGVFNYIGEGINESSEKLFEFSQTSRGHTYLEAFCYLDNDERTFKVVRIKEIKIE